MDVIWKIENGPALIKPKMFFDERGYFYESFNGKEFREKVADVEFVQDNQSKSDYGALRGMHRQTGEHAQAKLVRVVKGAVVDVIVDARKGSINYGKVYNAYLSEENHRQLYVPAGFLHGFLTLRDGTVFQYKCSTYYNKESEDGVLWSSIPFQWSDFVDESDFVISEKDMEAEPFGLFTGC